MRHRFEIVIAKDAIRPTHVPDGGPYRYRTLSLARRKQKKLQRKLKGSDAFAIYLVLDLQKGTWV